MKITYLSERTGLEWIGLAFKVFLPFFLSFHC